MLRSKRNRETCFDYSLCMFCQCYKSVGSLSKLGSQVVAKVKYSLADRIKYQDLKNVDMIDRLQNMHFESADVDQKLVYHKEC